MERVWGWIVVVSYSKPRGVSSLSVRELTASHLKGFSCEPWKNEPLGRGLW